MRSFFSSHTFNVISCKYHPSPGRDPFLPVLPKSLPLPHITTVSHPSLHSAALVAELVGIGGGWRPRPQSTGADRDLLGYLVWKW